MKPLSVSEMMLLKTAKQNFADCYLVSSISSLARTKKGQKIIQSNISHVDGGFNIRFNNVNNVAEDYFVSQKECDSLVLLDRYVNEVKIEHNPIIKAIEVAMNKLIKKHPNKKNFAARMIDCNEEFEYNMPSNFLQMFTGKKAFIFNEYEPFMTMKPKKKEAIDYFNRIGQAKDYNIVVGTGLSFWSRLPDFHCYTLENVNLNNKSLTIYDCRRNESITLSFKKAIKNLKFIVGYFDDML